MKENRSKRKKSAKRFYASDLAFLHNQHYSDFVTKSAPGAISMLREMGIKRGTVLDLGCGGGQLSAKLLAAGYTPVGVDVSAAMVRIARRQVPAAKFIQGSITTAVLPRSAGAIAIGEVFNYLPSRAEIVRAFKNIFRALLPGGVLLFDIKEPLPGKGKKTRTGARWGNDWAILVEVEEDPQREMLIRKIVSFQKSAGQHKRSDETHRQIILPAREITLLLRRAGFQVRVMRGYKSYLLSNDRKALLAKKAKNQ